VSSTGAEAIELVERAGLVLDPWQRFILANALNERADGRWAALEVGVVVPRQNGKGALLEARSLVGLFLLGERLITHSAHLFDTSMEAFHRLLALIEGAPDLDRLVKRVTRSHGDEGIEIRGGRRIRFRTRTKGGGRGFSGDCLILDEAMFLPEATVGALWPTLTARENPQVWYAGSAVDQNVHDHGMALARLRRRGIEGGEEALAYFEHSADADLDTVHAVAGDERTWAQANPGLGIRLRADVIAAEQRAMDPRTFATERLGVGDWPSGRPADDDLITLAAWEACEDDASQLVGPVCVAFDVTPDRSRAAIGVAGTRDDGRAHVEVIDHRRGTGWVAQRLAELQDRHDVAGIWCDERSPAAALLKGMRERRMIVTAVSTTEYAQACGQLVDAVNEDGLRHLGTPELKAAVLGATRRPLGDAWAWSRKSSAVDICPLVACTLALRGVGEQPPSVYEQRGILTV
jgi:phage terminase large subunit-like protein